jgi:hypothetical protein
MLSAKRLRASGILTVILIFLAAILDMVFQLNWVDSLLSPWVIASTFLASYLLAPWIIDLLKVKEL